MNKADLIRFFIWNYKFQFMRHEYHNVSILYKRPLNSHHIIKFED